MRVLIAPDKFKGTLTASAAARAISRGWRAARPADEVRRLPISDGGDGFGAAIGELLGAQSRRVTTLDAAHRRTRACWWWERGTRTAIIESARVVGLAMLPSGRYHPFELDTYGLGIVLRRAEAAGARRCLIGLGGSATNDGGFGLACALGWKFMGPHGQAIEQWTGLEHLREILPPAKPKLAMEILVAVDVQNPLLGKRGATRVYGPQKGIGPADFRAAEACLRRLAVVAQRTLGRDFARVPGAGAAGGLGFGFLAFAGGRMVPGFELFAKEAGLQRQLDWADMVITGEGCIDESTLMGKGVGQLLMRCRKLRKPCVGLAGAVNLGPSAARRFARAIGLTDVATEAEAKRNAGFLLERLAFRAGREWAEKEGRNP